jgi:hypothetical protein
MCISHTRRCEETKFWLSFKLEMEFLIYCREFYIFILRESKFWGKRLTKSNNFEFLSTLRIGFLVIFALINTLCLLLGLY